MENIKIKNDRGLELTVTTDHPEYYSSIMGGMPTNPSWDEYLDDYKEEFKPHLLLIKESIEKLGWVGETADHRANDTCFVFSDKIAISFSWRAWGDLMSAIVGKKEGYMAYYM